MEKASENQPLFSFSLFSPSGENFSTTFKYLETDLFRQRHFFFKEVKFIAKIPHALNNVKERMLFSARVMN
jgi:hypothetical protein